MKSNSPHIKPLQNNEPKQSDQDTNEELIFENIFAAVDEKNAEFLKESSDLLIGIRVFWLKIRYPTQLNTSGR
jgi:phosphoribosyl-ATP pyrophosphohydrolase